MESSKYFYNAFGLGIESEFKLEGLENASSGNDIRIEKIYIDEDYVLSEFSDASFFERQETYVWATPEKVCYIWEGYGAAVVRDGNTIQIDPYESGDGIKMSPFVTGALFGHLLNQRGISVLHGSSVLSDKGVWMFLGDKGAGKSTTAMLLSKRGYPVYSDDLVPIIKTPDGIHTRPGFPRSKLWPDSVRSLGIEVESLPRIMPFLDKRAIDTDHSKPEVANIKGVFVLETGSKPSITRLPAGKAFFEIQKNLYLANYLSVTSAAKRGFEDCEKIVKDIPVFQLMRSDSMDELESLIKLVSDQIKAES